MTITIFIVYNILLFKSQHVKMLILLKKLFIKND